jgi:membrane fusion protein, heavy metal efflux system
LSVSFKWFTSIMLITVVLHPRISLRRALSVALLTATVLAGSTLSGRAHEGHEHGPPPPPLPTTAKPRVAVHSDAYELVAIANGERLTLFLDRTVGNIPVPDARIEILTGAKTVLAPAQVDGTYVATIPGLSATGRYPLVFTIAHTNGDDLLEGTLTIAPPVSLTDHAPGPTPAEPLPFALLSLVGAAGLIAGLALGRRTPVVAVLCIVALGTALIVRAPPALAHEGHPLSPAPSSDNLSGDTPRRLPDGSVFLPKPSQRLLTVRTQVAVEGEANRTATLVGRIIADPNRAGVVQSINGGRVAAPSGGFPRLGQSVAVGQLLATVIPALPLADQSTLAEKAREIEGQMALSEQKLTRLSRLSAGTIPRSQIEDIELEIANARRRLDSLRETKIQPESLAAPVAGIISASRAVAGQVVMPQDILFQIVDPKGIWVEALAFDQVDPGDIVSATAILSDGTRTPLTFEGRGRALQQQATVLQFSITDPPATSVLGSPVTVIARQSRTLKGMLLPRDAVIRGAGGESIVWQHLDPERFVPRQVRFEPFDGEQVLITAGIAAKDRIVVHGVELLAQVR